VDIDDVARSLAALTDRVAALEGSATPARPSSDQPLVSQLIQRLHGGGEPHDVLLYAGVGGWDGQTLAWQAERSWDEVRASPAEQSAAALAALGNPTRVRIVVELLRRRLTTAQLAERLDQPSSGQLFHHLKELLAAGVVHQPVRGTYAVREQHVIPLFAVLCAVMDLGPSIPWEES
jgi:DNA-binding transcriptional ArsR family regulator